MGKERSLAGIPGSRRSRDPRGTGAQGRSHGSLDATLSPKPQALEDR